MSATFRKANEEVRQEISNSLLRIGNTGRKLAFFFWLVNFCHILNMKLEYVIDQFIMGGEMI